MNGCVKRLSYILLLVPALYTGCAKQGTVRRDEPVVPAASAPAKETSPATGILPKQQPAPAATAPQVPVPPAAQQSPAPVQPTAPGNAELQRQLGNIYFDFDSPTLSGPSRQTLAGNAALLLSNPQLTVRVEGHCDERGSDEYNLALGQQRAQAAVDYLRSLGVAKDRLSALSYGKEKPAVPGHDEPSWARNRRDEFIIVK